MEEGSAVPEVPVNVFGAERDGRAGSTAEPALHTSKCHGCEQGVRGRGTRGPKYLVMTIAVPLRKEAVRPAVVGCDSRP